MVTGIGMEEMEALGGRGGEGKAFQSIEFYRLFQISQLREPNQMHPSQKDPLKEDVFAEWSPPL